MELSPLLLALLLLVSWVVGFGRRRSERRGAAAVGVVECGGSWLAIIPAWLKLSPKEKKAAGPTEIAESRAAEKRLDVQLACAAPRGESSAFDVWA